MRAGSAQPALNVIEVESVNTDRSLRMYGAARVMHDECVELKVYGVLITATGLDQSQPLAIRLSSQPIFSHFVIHFSYLLWWKLYQTVYQKVCCESTMAWKLTI